ncbi:MAG: hypothetical protein U0V74_06000 [Chitinophagales bacterium]
MSGIEFYKNRVLKDGKVLYEFNENIDQLLELDTLLFVLLQDQREKINNRNLYCIDANGKLIWQCEDMLANRPPDSLEPPYAHYISIWIENGQLWGRNYFGTHDNRLDINTGKIVESYYMK